ncbi:YlbF family regulator [Salirhabdus sp. Marseille-P4669]|uniref:YlbF family regulator n=1 Tax=Salirhabdus sp. Marseille-P4669 TaxID=2042310 RepID=UPI000C7E7BAE|nr:YlbF family regulator [Salirhabdus sp. Marseille-P4669]
MLATLDIVDLFDRSEVLGKMILQSETFENYLKAKHKLENDLEAQKRIIAFQRIKEQYEDAQRFGRYHPDYTKIMKEVREVKREMDLNETVAAYKRAETELQALLDDVSAAIAETVSPSIKVPRDGALFSDSGCGCGSGGSCGCSA